jgi:hypothetical protein
MPDISREDEIAKPKHWGNGHDEKVVGCMWWAGAYVSRK